MVRKSCAMRIGFFATQLENECIINELIPAFKQLTTDDQDGIRVLCIEGLIPIAKTLQREDNRRHILPILLNSTEDKSWKVRLSIAKNYAELAKAFGKEITDGNLVTKLAGLLKDVEADVRTAAVVSLKSCVRNGAEKLQLISSDKIQGVLLPTLNTLIQDSTFNVKGTLTLSLHSRPRRNSL